MRVSVRVLIGLLLVICLYGTAISAQAETWDFKNQLSLTNNATSTWRCGYLDDKNVFIPYNTKLNLPFGLAGLALDNDPAIAGDITINTTQEQIEQFGSVWEPGQICIHPAGDGKQSVIRWISPVTAAVRVNAHFSAIGLMNPARVCVAKNTNSVQSTAIDGFVGKGSGRVGRTGKTPEQDFVNTIQVSKGDIIDFIFSRGDNQDQKDNAESDAINLGEGLDQVGHIALDAVIEVVEQ
jgi:hypothetical protein